jgi:hypothetical protein
MVRRLVGGHLYYKRKIFFLCGHNLIICLYKCGLYYISLCPNIEIMKNLVVSNGTGNGDHLRINFQMQNNHDNTMIHIEIFMI